MERGGYEILNDKKASELPFKLRQKLSKREKLKVHRFVFTHQEMDANYVFMYAYMSFHVSVIILYIYHVSIPTKH